MGKSLGAVASTFLGLLMGLLNFTASAATGNSTVGATIIAPIAINTTTNMNFGKIASSNVAGTVVLTPAGLRSKTGGVTLVSTGSGHTQAVFGIVGTASLTYAITLPTTTNITSGANTMTVNTFTSTPTGTSTLSAGGTDTLNVGATLNVNANQVAAIYSGSFTVTVDYN